VVEGIDLSATTKPLKETRLDRALKESGLLPENALRCRYCEGPIAVDTKQCPHCKLWLVEDFPLSDLDPWQHDYDDRKTRKVDMLGPRAGCFSIFALLCVTIITATLKIAIL
jgi:hypothetical protein